jgi:hypothetical protein
MVATLDGQKDAGVNPFFADFSGRNHGCDSGWAESFTNCGGCGGFMGVATMVATVDGQKIIIP